MRCKINPDRFTGKNVLTHRDGWTSDELNPEEEYLIFAIGEYDDRIMILIDESKRCRPNWHMLEDFVLTDRRISEHWCFSSEVLEQGWKFISGYEEIVFQPKHLRGLIERNENDLRTFLRAQNRQLNETTALD